MAPCIDTISSVSFTFAIMSAAPTPSAAAFSSLVLGRSSHAIELLVPPAPSVQSATDLKARCFDFLADLLLEHSILYSSAELIAAFGHIPSSSYNAALEAAGTCSSIRSAFFHLENMVALGFRDHLGAPVTTAITADPTNRPSGIAYFAFRSTVDPAAIDTRLTIPCHSFEFWLALPQTVSIPVPTAAAVPSVVRALDYLSTPQPPTGPPAPAPITASDYALLSSAEQDALGTTTSSDLLSDYAPCCLPLLSATQLQFLVLRSAAATPATTAPSAISTLSPRMTAVLAASNTASSSFYGSLDFLDSQSSFDAVFPLPVPLLVTISSSGTSIDSTSLPTKLNRFLDTCKFRLFIPLFRFDYVGSSDRDDSAALHATIQALKKPAMTRRNPVSGAYINMSPDELYAAYADLTPLLPNRVSLWGLNLVTQFFDALSWDLQEAIQSDPAYSAPDLSTLVTRSSQLAALRSLRATAVRQYTILKNHERLIYRTVQRRLKNNTAPTSSSPVMVTTDPTPTTQTDDESPLAQTFMSPAEQTISRYQPSPTNPPISAEFPVDPITKFQSCYPAGFQGCMFCGATEHRFKECPTRSTPGSTAVFYKHLFAHKPHLRQRDPTPTPSAGGTTPATQSFPSTTAESTPPNQTPGTRSVTFASLPPPALNDPSRPTSKKPRIFVQLVKSFAARLPAPATPLPLMPIAIDNGLPYLTFNLGADPDADPSLSGLMDTCAALNTGYLLFHLWLKSERPYLVAEFITFDDSNPFEPVKLGGAIRDPSNFDATDHGNLTAVIRYYTPYHDTSGAPITISFALGPDVTVNTIFGLPMLCSLDAVISLGSNSMHSHALNVDFPLTRAAATFGLPPGCAFDSAAASRNHVSTCNLQPSPVEPSSPTTPSLATATDDMSLGFLKRTVPPSL